MKKVATFEKEDFVSLKDMIKKSSRHQKWAHLSFLKKC